MGVGITCQACVPARKGGEQRPSTSLNTCSDDTTSNEEKRSRSSSAIASESLIEELDQLLGQYYASKHRNDYFDDKGRGKFQSYCVEMEIDDEKLADYMEKWTNEQWHAISDSKWFLEFLMTQYGRFPFFQTPRELSRQDLQMTHQLGQLSHLFFELYQLRSVPTDSELSINFNAIERWQSIHEMDLLLGEYYASNEYNNYFDGTGRGKFRLMMEDIAFDDDILQSWMIQDRFRKDLESWLFHEHFHSNDEFPSFQTSQESVPRELQKKQFAHLFLKLNRLRAVPTNDELRMSFLRESISWWHVAECLKHEMHTAISNKMHEVIDDIKSSKVISVGDIGEEAVRKFIDLLQRKRRLSNKEVIFIQNAVGRAREFKSRKEESAIS